jgi:surfeit locus 1 family protein
MKAPSAWLAAICVVLLTAIFSAAGFWQVARAHYKDRMQVEIAAAAHAPALHAGADMLDATAAHLRRVEAQGEWLVEKTILLDNKVRNGVVGYEVVTPLRLDGGARYLLVDRGWIAAPKLRRDLPQSATPAGKVAVEGVARIPNPRFIELGGDVVSGQIWQNLTIERYRDWSQLPLQPVLLYQQGGAEDGLLRVEAAPEASGLSADRHRGYALMWFSLAGMTIALGLLSWFRNTNPKTN